LENVKAALLGRRRSLSLDDLGLNGYDTNDNAGSASPLPYHTETDEEDIEELPEDCTSATLDRKHEDPGASTPIAEEWSPSPNGDKEQAQSSSLNSSSTVSSNKSKSIIQNYLTKWKNKIKK